jgi:UDP-N-acetylmuramate: L-alanyl-gamma-D-glutamyl-meso-diaminopimelate ligase
MKMGIWKEKLSASLAVADRVFCYTDQANWDVQDALQLPDNKSTCFNDLPQLIQAISTTAQPGSHVLIMSNGSFDNIHEKLLIALDKKDKNI